MTKIKGFAAYNSASPLAPYEFTRRAPRANDVVIKIDYCGICHSDVHQAKNEWGATVYPIVPGHEIVGHITAIGSNVKNFKVGDLAGVGCLVDSCLSCPDCQDHQEQFCQNGRVGTYNSTERDGVTRTYGGYSESIVVREEFALKIPKNLNLAGVAPLLCAGITTYSPLKKWKIGKNSKVAVFGLGGLGHMAVQFAKSFGAHVSVFTRCENKIGEAKKLGADEVYSTKHQMELAIKLANKFDFIIDTVSAPHDLNFNLSLLKRDGSCVLVGLPDVPPTIEVGNLIMGRKNLAGSLIGGIKETQEMLDYCGEHNITSVVEVIAPNEVNNAYERMLKSDVKYRFVMDMSKL